MSLSAAVGRRSLCSREIDRICDRFELAWRSGQAISIEELTPQRALSNESDKLLGELIAVEVELRREQGADPKAKEYVNRFPWYATEIQILFSDSLGVSGLPTTWHSSEYERTTSKSETIILPGYEILEELGRGSMGIVYKARELLLNRLVALKLIQTDVPTSRVRRHFLHEAKTIAQLRHCGIVQIFGVEEHEGQPYLVLELIDGCGLNEWLDGSPQPQHWVASLAAQIARILDYTHQHGVIHRDIKPANVLLTTSRDNLRNSGLGIESPICSRAGQPALGGFIEPVITDFGLAKQLYSSETVSGDGAIFGTPDYMAPEQAQGRSKDATPAADVYSVGAILYEMLTGRPPIEGSTPLETLRNVCRLTPVPVRSLRPGVSQELEAICLQCLEKDPEDRFTSAADLADALVVNAAENEPSISSQDIYSMRHLRFSRAIAAGISGVNRLIGRGLTSLNLRRAA